MIQINNSNTNSITALQIQYSNQFISFKFKTDYHQFGFINRQTLHIECIILLRIVALVISELGMRQQDLSYIS